MIGHIHTLAAEKLSSSDSSEHEWWAVRDGVLWSAVPGGFKDGGTIKPFSFTAVYRGACIAPSCPGAAFYDVTLRPSAHRGVAGG
jgi:hypothetical protein|eukprot:472423-Prymnesium_polylepis.1